MLGFIVCDGHTMVESRWKGRKVALLYGGTTSERAISLKTGAAFSDALKRLGVDLVELDFGDAAIVELATTKVEAALIALHGLEGEGGPVQGLLECLRIPYTGSGVQASSLAIDKIASKRALLAQGVPTLPWIEVGADGMEALEAFGAPCVIKPPREGSSVGISIVHEASGLADALALALRYDTRILVERFVRARELSVGFFDDELLGIIEVKPAEGYYDYEAKYVRGDTQYLLPAPLSDEERTTVARVARQAWDAIGCRGVGRVDVLLEPSGAAWVLELNTVPGMTQTSIIPKMAAAKGLPFDALVERMLDAARLDVVRVEAAR